MKQLLNKVLGIETVEDGAKIRAAAEARNEANKLKKLMERIEAYRLELRQMANKPKSKRKAKMLKVYNASVSIGEKQMFLRQINYVSTYFHADFFRIQKLKIVPKCGNGQPEDFFAYTVKLPTKETGIFIAKPYSKEVFFIFYNEKNKKENWFGIIK